MSMDIKAELEIKKARLKALREEKDRKKREKDPKDVNDLKSFDLSTTLKNGKVEKNPNPNPNYHDLDAMLSSLGIPPVSADVLSSLSSSCSDLNNSNEHAIEVHTVDHVKVSPPLVLYFLETNGKITQTFLNILIFRKVEAYKGSFSSVTHRIALKANTGYWNVFRLSLRIGSFLVWWLSMILRTYLQNLSPRNSFKWEIWPKITFFHIHTPTKMKLCITKLK